MKDRVEEADETEQNAENVLTAITCVNLPKIKTAHKFDEVTAERDKTEELYVEQQNAVHTALASHKYFENNCTVLKKISVQASIKTAETDELSAKEGSGHNKVAAEFTETETEKISTRLQRGTKLRRLTCTVES